MMATLAAAVLLGWARPASAKAPPLDVVMVVIDSLRADHLGCYGYSRPTSPHIDAIAREGAVFKNAVAQANWTLPSVASLLTSLYPSEHRAVLFPASPSEAKGLTSQQTLASLLREKGYHTAAFTAGPFLKSAFGFDHGFSEYIHGTQDAEEFDRLILPWLERHRNEPFFLYIHLQDVHAPYGKKTAFARRWDLAYRGEADGSVAYIDGIASRQIVPTQRDLRHVISLYDSGIAYADKNLQEVVSRLEALGLRRHAIVILTADHGESFLDHGSRMLHGTSPYEEELRVPLILAGPGVRAGPIDAPVQLVDVLPTVLELLGVAAPAQARGVSLVPLIEGRAQAGRAVLSEPSANGGRDGNAPLGFQVARARRWKLIHPLYGSSDELYDLSADPGERKDLAATSRTVVAEMRALLKRWQAARERVSPADAAVPVERSLRALGYDDPR